MMAKCVDQSDRRSLDSFLKFILQVQFAALALIAIDWLLQQLELRPLTVGTHVFVIAIALYSARVVGQYHKQKVIPDLVNLTLRLGQQPIDIGPYNAVAYAATAWFFVAIGYAAHILMLLKIIH